jgi:hypothetical protein
VNPLAELELLGRDDWEDFLSAPLAVLILGKNGCAACEQWTLDLQQWFDSGQSPEGAKFGKLILDTPGLGRFKIAHPWVSEVDVLPYNAIYIDGERVKEWAGGNIPRLTNRLNRYL